MTQITPARLLAHQILLRVARSGAFAERALHAALNRTPLDGRDKALCTELVYGTLRSQPQIDARLVAHTHKPLASLAPPVLAALRMGAYQILFMRLPAHSAVHQSVALVQRFGSLKGFVNAILRKLLPVSPPLQSCVPPDSEALAELTMLPLWFVQDIAEQRGLAGARAFCMTTAMRAPVCLRVNLARSNLTTFVDKLAGAGVRAVAAKLCPERCLEVTRPGAITALPGYAEGHFCVQDPAATHTLLASLSTQPSPTTVLDLCAAPGGKTTLLAELYPQARLGASDIHPGKLALIEKNCARLGNRNVQLAALDARDKAQLASFACATFGSTQAQLVVLDAPCSGMGTLRRHPELKARHHPQQMGLLELQRQLLDSAAARVAPNGHLVYSVCTPQRAETTAQLQGFGARHPDFSLVHTHMTWTDLCGADALFAATWRRIN